MATLQVDNDGSRGRSPSAARSGERRRGESPSLLDAVRMPSPPPGFSYDDEPPRRSAYDHDGSRSSYRARTPTNEPSYYHASRESLGSDDSRYPKRAGESRTSKGDKDVVGAVQETLQRGADALLPAKYVNRLLETDSERDRRKEEKKKKLEEDLAYGSAHSRPEPQRPGSRDRATYVASGRYEDGRPSSRPGSYYGRPGSPDGRPRDSYGASVRVVEPRPSSRGSRGERSPSRRMSRLTVNTGHHAASLSVSSIPASPLLESYYGTYQAMSPLLLAVNDPKNSDLVEPLSPGLSDGEGGGDKKRRRARFHDPVDDAARLAKALKGDRSLPDIDPLVEILPGMTHDQLMDLRIEYKRLVKTGPERKGVNVAKHIRARLKDEEPTLMKACYTVALGKWESEAYWANFWYHGDKTRRELLIESLMGRSNYEIAQIKNAFADKKYQDSLTLCMKTELKEDKFKRAVLTVLDLKRMEDVDEYGRVIPVDRRLVQDDVEALYKAIQSDRGGESAMIDIVISRSDHHLRDVLKLYERTFGSNFARDALKKSGNLVGEVLAHVLNGVINKPVRDALLLRHALTASKKDHLRRELLISRLVRFHWDGHHMGAIKRAYRERYNEELADAVRDGTSGAWGHFCEQLVVTRMPDDVKSFEKVAAVKDIKRDREREERLKERERELDREKEDREREERRRRSEKERDRGRSEGLLVINDVKNRNGSRSRERSRRRE
ncbi:hypothetical protein GGS23DRAFT_194770 [Durotheca rogersii]|uniref:uncharacterized protein n=1 Tax=Durotheca rogersii TaxID=419775 RepID=UPI00221E8A93|nr:uncharacterized protein GGS23DRAFT_194770 [Durotheca rogersii]KAI5867775.1 hypothetical protein GGS23DRAFT_194770 [Durotheca rogersii]